MATCTRTADTRPSQIRWVILAALCLAATAAYMQRQCLGTVEKPIREELILTKDEMGSLLSSFFVTYALLQIPAGKWAERFGTRRALSAMMLAWSVACGLGAAIQGTSGIVVCRLLMGAAQAGIFTCTTISIRRWMPANRFGLANGLLAGFMQVGGIIGSSFAGWLTTVFGWRFMFLVFAAPGALLAVLFYWFFRDDPREHPRVNSLERDLLPAPDESPTATIPVPWMALVLSWPLWCLATQQFLRAGAQMFFGSWFPTYLQEVRGVSLTTAGILNALPMTAMAAGPVVGGWGSDWLETKTGNRRISRQGLAVACLLICAGLIWVGYKIDDPVAFVLVICIGSFFAAAAGPAAYIATIDMGGPHLAVVFAIMNMGGNFGAAAFPKVIPWILATSPAADPSAPQLPPDWDGVFAFFVGLYIVAAIAWIPFNSSRQIVKTSVEK